MMCIGNLLFECLFEDQIHHKDSTLNLSNIRLECIYQCRLEFKDDILCYAACLISKLLRKTYQEWLNVYVKNWRAPSRDKSRRTNGRRPAFVFFHGENQYAFFFFIGNFFFFRFGGGPPRSPPPSVPGSKSDEGSNYFSR